MTDKSGYPILNIERGPVGRDAVLIARPSPLGNPYAIGPDGDRDTVIEKYRAWLDARIAERDPVVCTALLGIRPGQPLACHCAPARCHGEVIAKALESGRVAALKTRVPSLRYAAFTPWDGYGERELLAQGYNEQTYDGLPSSEALRLAASLEPKWKRLTELVQIRFAKDCHLVLGPDLRSPVDVVIRGNDGEGRLAVLLAQRWGIGVRG